MSSIRVGTVALGAILFSAVPSLGRHAGQAPERSLLGDFLNDTKSLLARDMAGLDPTEGRISKNLRGSYLVKHYIAGPWQGGKAVIEVAQDLSYTEIAIYDDAGDLRRVYSLHPKSPGATPPPGAARAKETEQAKSEVASVPLSTPPPADSAAPVVVATNPPPPLPVSAPAAAVPVTPTPTPTPTPIVATPATSVTPSVASAGSTKRKKRTRRAQNSLDTPLSGRSPEPEETVEEAAPPVSKPSVASSKSPQVAPAAVSADQTVPVTSTRPPSPAPSPKSPQVAPVAVADDQSAPVASPRSSSAAPSPKSSSVSLSETSSDQAVPRPSNPPSTPTPPSKSSQMALTEETSNPPVQLPPPPSSKHHRSPKSSQVASVSMEEEPSNPSVPVTPTSTLKYTPPEDHTSQVADAIMGSFEPATEPVVPKQSATTSVALPTVPSKTISDAAGLSATSPTSTPTSVPDELIPPPEAPATDVVTTAKTATVVATARPMGHEKKKEEEMVALLESLKGPASKPKVSPVMNSPETEKVTFSWLEKVSGPRLGKHREYERHVVNQPNPNAPIRKYDFYLDETDRKKGTHVLYYYQVDPKTQKAKLMAVEKHDHVTFRPNFDINQESEAKVTKY